MKNQNMFNGIIIREKNTMQYLQNHLAKKLINLKIKKFIVLI